MTIEEENKLIEQANQEDAGAMARLYGEYYGMLIKASRQRKVHTVSEDALSVATIAFVEAVNDYSADRGVNFAAFAKSRVYAGVHQFFREECRHWEHEIFPTAREEELDPWEIIADPRDAVSELEGNMVLESATALLSEKEKRVLLLTVFRDMSQKAAAELLQVSAQAVSKMRKRILEKLREAGFGRVSVET